MLSACAMAHPIDGERPFRFEDYKDKTAFQAALEDRFPVGSDFEVMKEELINAGASTNFTDKGYEGFKYRKNIWWSVFGYLSWGVNVEVDAQNKIRKILSGYSATGL